MCLYSIEKGDLRIREPCSNARGAKFEFAKQEDGLSRLSRRWQSFSSSAHHFPTLFWAGTAPCQPPFTAWQKNHKGSLFSGGTVGGPIQSLSSLPRSLVAEGSGAGQGHQEARATVMAVACLGDSLGLPCSAAGSISDQSPSERERDLTTHTKHGCFLQLTSFSSGSSMGGSQHQAWLLA